MSEEVRNYINAQEDNIKAQYEVLKDKGLFTLIKKEISLQERYEDIYNAIKYSYNALDIEKEVSIGF